jgi:hypothetical protein
MYKPSSFSENETGPIRPDPIIIAYDVTSCAVCTGYGYQLFCRPLLTVPPRWNNYGGHLGKYATLRKKKASIIDDNLRSFSVRPGCTWWPMFCSGWLFGGLWLRARLLVHVSLLWCRKKKRNNTRVAHVIFSNNPYIKQLIFLHPKAS